VQRKQRHIGKHRSRGHGAQRFELRPRDAAG
jgi:hypothetical protein